MLFWRVQYEDICYHEKDAHNRGGGNIRCCGSCNYRAVSPTSAMAQLEEYELEVLAGKKKELPVYSVERSDMKIAITVDAAWEDDKTQFILDTFDEYGVKATFFLCGYWTDKYPDDVKMIAERGHEIGNHSATHPHMNSISKEQMRKETVEYDDKIEKLAGKRCKVFRAPFGEYNDTVITTMRSLGYEVIQWDIDTMDTICKGGFWVNYL